MGFTNIQFLEQFKQNNQVQHGQYALRLIDKANADPIRHFGLHLLEHMVAYSIGNSAVLKEIAGMVLQYVNSQMKPFFEEATFIKEKVASLIVGVMKREWPTRQPQLLDDVIKLAQMGQVQREVCILTIRTLVCLI